MPNTITKYYTVYGGQDLKSSDLTREPVYASGLLNTQYTKSGAHEKRSGYQAQGNSQIGFGDAIYNRVNSTTGIESPEFLTFSSSVFKRNTTLLNVTYGGAQQFCTISIYFDTAADVYRCMIIEGTTTVLTQSLGIGVDETSPYMVSTLAATINAIPNFTATTSGSPTTTPAAFLRIVREFDLKSASLSAKSYYWTELNKTVTSPLAGSTTNKDSTDFENVSAAQLQNVIYMSNGYDDLLKYDGQTVYRAGMPNTTAAPVVANGGAGLIAAGTYNWSYSYLQIDATNNTTEGNRSLQSSLTSGGVFFANVTVNNVLAGSGFNTNCALVNGNQVGVNIITVTNPHTMKIGDTAYFLERSSGLYVTRAVTSISATTITVAGAVVNVNTGDAISNNLRIPIYRTKSGGTSPFLVAEIPNNSFAATTVFVDNLVDASLTAQFLEPFFDRDPPPRGKYLASFDGELFVGGSLTSPKTVFHSSIEGPEYFPADGSHEDDVEAPGGDKIAGIGGNSDVFVAFSSRSTHIYSGDIRSLNHRVQPLTFDIGCAAHATIQDIRGVLAFLSDRGPYGMQNGQIPEPLGDERVEPLFDQIGQTTAQTLQLKRSIGFNDRRGQKYLLYIPAESTTLGNLNPNSNSIVLAFDYFREAWLQWNNINAYGGITFFENDIFFHERRYSTTTASIKNYLYRMMVTGDAYDYQDNTGPVIWNVKTIWEALGEPSVFKKFLRLKAFQLEPTTNNEFVLTVKMETDYLKDFTRGATTLDFNSAAGYGESAYGLGPYGDFIEQTRKCKLANGHWRSMRIVFENSEEQANVLLTGWELEIATPFDTQIKE